MNSIYIKNFLEDQGLQPDPKHIATAASSISSLLKTTAERFSKLPLEAEPSGFHAEQRRNAP
jgi:hypothetical protein